MRRQLVIAIALILLAAGQVAAYDLSQHHWRHRLLLLIAPEGDDPDLSAQRRDIVQRRDSMLDRDLLLFLLLPDRGFVGDKALPTRTVVKLREQLGVTPDDRLLILIGKDGGEKRRAELRTDLRDIFLQIDAMPMRRDEISAKEQAGKDVTSP